MKWDSLSCTLCFIWTSSNTTIAVSLWGKIIEASCGGSAASLLHRKKCTHRPQIEMFWYAWNRFEHAQLDSYYHFCFLGNISWCLITATSGCWLVFNSGPRDPQNIPVFFLGFVWWEFSEEWQLCCWDVHGPPSCETESCFGPQNAFPLTLPEVMERVAFPSGGEVWRAKLAQSPLYLLGSVRPRCLLRYFHCEEWLQWGEGDLREAT